MLWFWGTGMCKFVKKPDLFILTACTQLYNLHI